MPSDIDHYRGLDIWCPVSADEVWGLAQAAMLGASSQVLDVGCGQAETLIRLAGAHGARITGVDRSAAALRLARERAQEFAPTAQATWIQQEMNELQFEDGTFELVLALGGPYRNDSLEQTLRLYARWARPGGHALLGDGFWAQPPDPAYLAATGLEDEALRSRSDYLALAVECGLEPVDHLIASRAGWDQFESTLLRNHERQALPFAGDPQVETKLASKRAWAAAQARWGRDTMGFALDLFRVRS